MRALVLLGYLIAAISVGGCIGGGDEAGVSPSPSSAPPGSFDETTGALTGTVADAELNPVADADLSLKEAEIATKSSPDGSFSFSNVNPGVYTLLAAKLGFVSTAQKVEIKAGEATEGVKVLLAPLPVVEPYVLTYDFKGFITCSVGYAVILSEECGEGVQNPVLPPIGKDPNNKIDWKFNITDTTNLQTIYLELTWKPASAAAQQLAFNVAHGFTCIPSCDAKLTYCGAFENFGHPIVKCEITPDTLGIKDTSKELPWDITARAWAAPSPETDPPNVVLQQSFSMYRTEFYGLPKPEGYSAVVDE